VVTRRDCFRSSGIMRSGTRDDTLYHIHWMGQSLATGTYDTQNWGGDQGPCLNPVSYGLRSLMFSGGVRVGIQPYVGNVAVSVSLSVLSTLVPLVEVDDGNPVGGQSHAQTMCTALAQYLEQKTGKQFLFSGTAIDAERMTGINKGQPPYINALACVTAAMNWCRKRGIKYVFLCVCWEHGEADQSFNSATYQADLATIQANWQADVQAITGQRGTIPFFMTQQIDFPPAFTSGISTAWAELLGSLAAPQAIKVIHSKYHQQGNSDNIHRAPCVSKWAGAEYGKAIVQDRFQGILWQPIYPLRSVISGTSITTRFNVPVAPLVFDYAAVLQNNWPMGVSATGTATMKCVAAAVVAGGTSGFAVNDTITLTGGAFTTAIVLKVSSVTSGVVTGVTIQTAGSYTVLPANPVSQGSTSGAGVGTCTFTITWGVNSVTLTAAGNGYPAGTTVTFSGGAGSGATATANFTGNGTMAVPTITAPGTGYTSLPSVTFTGPAGMVNGGFSFWDDSASPPTITNAVIQGNGIDIVFTLSGTPTGSAGSQVLRYAWGTNINQNSYSTIGAARGNLRDSDPSIGPDGHPLFDFCAHFSQVVQAPGT
jgi:hypothetical protein